MTGATIGKFTMVPKMHKTILVNQRVGKFFLGENPINKIPFIYCTLKQPEISQKLLIVVKEVLSPTSVHPI